MITIRVMRRVWNNRSLGQTNLTALLNAGQQTPLFVKELVHKPGRDINAIDLTGMRFMNGGPPASRFARSFDGPSETSVVDIANEHHRLSPQDRFEQLPTGVFDRVERLGPDSSVEQI
jgi:hypothetical protein